MNAKPLAGPVVLLCALVSACGGGGGGSATLPTVSITLGSASVKIHDETTLTWSSTGATGCTASGAWSGAQPTSGSMAVSSDAAGSFTYTLACTNADGTRSASATLSVVARTAADYFRYEDTGLVILNDNTNTTRSLHAIQNLDLNDDGVMDSILVGPEFEIGHSGPLSASDFKRQSAHVVLGGPTAASGASLFPSGRPSYIVSNYPVVHDFNDDGKRDIFVPEFGPDADPFPGGQSGAWLSGGGIYSPATMQAAVRCMHGASAGTVAGKPAIFPNGGGGEEREPFVYLYENGAFTIDRTRLPSLVTDSHPSGEAQQDADRIWTASAMADLDGDGFDELALGKTDDAVDPPLNGNFVVFGTSSGWQSGAVVRLPDPQGIAFTEFNAVSLSAVDVDGDGKKDLILGYTDHYTTRGIQVLHNVGDRTFTDISVAMLGAEASVSGCPGSTLPAVDVNGDQCIDLIEPELNCASTGSQRGRMLINDCNGAFVNANSALESVLSQVALVPMFPFTDYTGRTSFYVPVSEPPSSSSGGLYGTRYRKLKNLANLPTPVGGQIVFD